MDNSQFSSEGRLLALCTILERRQLPHDGISIGRARTSYKTHDERSSGVDSSMCRTQSTSTDTIRRLDTRASRTVAISSAGLSQYRSFHKQTGGAATDRGVLPPASRNQALVQIPAGKGQPIQKHGTRSLPNSSLQEVVEPVPRQARSATIRKDVVDQRTSTKVPLPRINNLVTGELTSVSHQQHDHGFKMPAPAGVPTTRNVVLLASEKITKKDLLPTAVPEWLQNTRQEHQVKEKQKNEANKRTYDPSTKPWLQTTPKKSHDILNEKQDAGPRVGVFHAPEGRQKTRTDVRQEEDGSKVPDRKQVKEQSFRTTERAARAPKVEKASEKTDGRNQSSERRRPVERRRVRKTTTQRLPDRLRDSGSTTESDDAESSSSSDDGLFSFVRPRQRQAAPPRAADSKGQRQTNVTAEDEDDKRRKQRDKRYTIQDAVGIYKQEYVRIKGKRPLGASSRHTQSSDVSPRTRAPTVPKKDKILSRREATMYQDISKVYGTDKVKRRRENQFYKKLLELQMKKWHEKYREHMKRQLERLDKLQEQESQLMRLRRKFIEEQMRRFRTQYITGRVLTHEWVNRSEYGLPDDSYLASIPPATKLIKKIKPKKFSFKKQYLKNKKKFDTIFKSRALFVNPKLKPPKMEGIDTVEIDGSRPKNVTDVLKEAEDILDQSDEESDDVTSSDDDTSVESFDRNVPTMYKTTRPQPRTLAKPSEQKKRRVVVVPAPKKTTADRWRRPQSGKSKAESKPRAKDLERRQPDVKTTPRGTLPKYKSQFGDWKTVPLHDDVSGSEKTTPTTTTRRTGQAPKSEPDSSARHLSEPTSADVQRQSANQIERSTQRQEEETRDVIKNDERPRSAQEKDEPAKEDTSKSELTSSLRKLTEPQRSPPSGKPGSEPEVDEKRRDEGKIVAPGITDSVPDSQLGNRKTDTGREDEVSSDQKGTFSKSREEPVVADGDVRTEPIKSKQAEMDKSDPDNENYVTTASRVRPPPGHRDPEADASDNNADRALEKDRNLNSTVDDLSKPKLEPVTEMPKAPSAKVSEPEEQRSDQPKPKTEIPRTERERYSPKQTERITNEFPRQSNDQVKTYDTDNLQSKPAVDKTKETSNIQPEKTTHGKREDSHSKPTGAKLLGTKEPTEPRSAKSVRTKEPVESADAKPAGTKEPTGPIGAKPVNKKEPIKPAGVKPERTKEPIKPTGAKLADTDISREPTDSRSVGTKESREPTGVAQTSKNLTPSRPTHSTSDQQMKKEKSNVVKPPVLKNPTKTEEKSHSKAEVDQEPSKRKKTNELKPKAPSRKENKPESKPARAPSPGLDWNESNKNKPRDVGRKKEQRRSGKTEQADDNAKQEQQQQRKSGNMKSKAKPKQRRDDDPRDAQKPAESKQVKQKNKKTKKEKKPTAPKDGRTDQKKAARPPSSKQDQEEFNISSYLSDNTLPNVYDLKLSLSDDDSSESDEDIFEKAMRKYGIRVDDSD